MFSFAMLLWHDLKPTVNPLPLLLPAVPIATFSSWHCCMCGPVHTPVPAIDYHMVLFLQAVFEASWTSLEQ
jgi:hypothetical protein